MEAACSLRTRSTLTQVLDRLIWRGGEPLPEVFEEMGLGHVVLTSSEAAIVLDESHLVRHFPFGVLLFEQAVSTRRTLITADHVMLNLNSD